MKICTKCKNQKELTEFGKSKYSKEGHKIYCKECSRADQKKYRDKNKENDIVCFFFLLFIIKLQLIV